MGFALRVHSGIASGYQVVHKCTSQVHIRVKINWCRDLVFGSGPTQCIKTLSNGSPITGIGRKGAKGTV